jgi:hypothetical protein
VKIQNVEMLTLIGGLCCVDFINRIIVVVVVRSQPLALHIGPS